MAFLRTPRSAWVEAGLEALGEGGLDAVRVEALAGSLGVTKGGFYGQFSDRRELLAAMLDAWVAGTDDVITEVEGAGGNARAKLERLLAIAQSRVPELVKVDLAVRDWARRDPLAAERVRQVDERRMAYMRALFAEVCADDGEAEARSLLVFSLFIGSNFVAGEHPGRTREEVLGLAVRYLLR